MPHPVTECSTIERIATAPRQLPLNLHLHWEQQSKQQINHKVLPFVALPMPPKKQSGNFGEVQKAALQKGFSSHAWDPSLTDGKSINALIKSVPEIFEVLRPWFSKAQGGTKENNNSIYTHFKTQASEYITNIASKEGVRISMWASVGAVS